MSVRVAIPKDRYSLPEFRAVCQGCRCEGPPVEGRPPHRGKAWDAAAASLTEKISGFKVELERAPGRKISYYVNLYCRTCVERRALVSPADQPAA